MIDGHLYVHVFHIHQGHSPDDTVILPGWTVPNSINQSAKRDDVEHMISFFWVMYYFKSVRTARVHRVLNFWVSLWQTELWWLEHANFQNAQSGMAGVLKT